MSVDCATELLNVDGRVFVSPIHAHNLCVINGMRQSRLESEVHASRHYPTRYRNANLETLGIIVLNAIFAIKLMDGDRPDADAGAQGRIPGK
jgi:hypothetical protein